MANSSYNDQVVLKKFTKFGPSRHSIAPLLVPRFALLLPLQLPSRFFVALESKSLVAQTWNPKDIRACPQKLVIVPAHPSFFFLQRKKSNAPVKTAWINRRQKSLICSFVTSIQTHIVSTAPSESSSPSSLSIYRFAGLARKRLFPLAILPKSALDFVIETGTFLLATANRIASFQKQPRFPLAFSSSGLCNASRDIAAPSRHYTNLITRSRIYPMRSQALFFVLHLCRTKIIWLDGSWPSHITCMYVCMYMGKRRTRWGGGGEATTGKGLLFFFPLPLSLFGLFLLSSKKYLHMQVCPKDSHLLDIDNIGRVWIYRP